MPVAEDKDICLTRKIETDISLSADNHKLQRVVANLLDNALKYTRKGGRVEISAYQIGQEAVIAFCDNGIGISEDDLQYIFKRFYRCDRSRSQPGVGLGLSLAQAIARAHGGNISVTSFRDKGSTFTLTLPYTH